MMNTDYHQRILVVIPAYNAAKHLGELVERISKATPGLSILVVDDGSTDETASILETLRVHHISFAHNSGKGAALLAGFDFARKNQYSAVLTMDADLQHAPEEIPCLVKQYNGQRIVIGSRKISGPLMPLPRVLSNSLTSLFISLFSGQRVRDSQSGFRLLPMTVLDNIELRSGEYDLESELLYKAGVAGIQIIEVEVSTIYIQTAKSYIAPLPVVLRFIRQTWKRIWM